MPECSRPIYQYISECAETPPPAADIELTRAERKRLARNYEALKKRLGMRSWREEIGDLCRWNQAAAQRANRLELWLDRRELMHTLRAAGVPDDPPDEWGY